MMPANANKSNHSPSPDRLGGSEMPIIGLRPKDAAKALGIGERLLWELTNRGEIPHTKLNSATVYPVEDLKRWLSEKAKANRK